MASRNVASRWVSGGVGAAATLLCRYCRLLEGLSGQSQENLVELGVAHGQILKGIPHGIEGWQLADELVGTDRHAHADATVASSTCGSPCASVAIASATRGMSSSDFTCTSTTLLPGRALSSAGVREAIRPAMVDDDDLACEVVGLVQVLGGEQDIGSLLDQGPDGIPQVDAGPGIQARGRLVEEEPGLADQACAQIELAPRSSLRRMPPEYVRTRRPAASVRPSISSTRAALARDAPRLCPNNRATSSMFSRPVIAGSTAAYWPASPIMLRTTCGSRPTSCPATRSSLPSGRSRVATARMKVVFPRRSVPARQAPAQARR
jgi:hypothetical protein